MLKTFISISLPLVMLLFSVAGQSKDLADNEQPEPAKILFVGNSFSFYNNGVHNHLGNLVRVAGKWQAGQSRVRLLTLSGARLNEHLVLLPPFLENDDTDWDFILLQGHSNEPLEPETETGFKDAAQSLASAIRKSGAVPVLLMTWAYENEPEMAAPLAEAYLALSNELQTPVAPVGLAFDRVRREEPTITLTVADVRGMANGEIIWRRDVKHPSLAGTYLAACVVYSTLFGRSTEGISYTAGLDDGVASKLQAIAWETVQAGSFKP